MEDYTDAEIFVLFDALDEYLSHKGQYPTVFTDEEALALDELHYAFMTEARYRNIIY
ncbi:hypothetical protein ABZ353_10920 [Streptomyces niveus]|uniref:hypothetical protein n=1 Tax=Streptomyces niveus TaxID=193462 RepID=UPI0033C62178